MSRKASVKKVAAALIAADGNMAAAGRALGVSRQDVWARVQATPKLRAVLDEFETVGRDYARSAIHRGLVNGDLPTARWFAERKMRDEGFGSSTSLRLDDDQIAGLVATLPVEALQKLAKGG